MNAKRNRAHLRVLRGLGWCVAAVAFWAAGSLPDALGGPGLGLVLAGSLATVLHVTRPPRATRRTTR